MALMERLRASASCALLLLVMAATAAPPGAGAAPSPHECKRLVDDYLAERTDDIDAPHDPSKFLFFLHVPRTAGKTYFSCFLKAAYPPSRRCAKSYDRLRLNVSTDSCALLVSHDDMSVVDQLPPAGATITQLRRPADRVLSSYEFAVDVAARRVHVNETEVRERENSGASDSVRVRDPHFISTLDVWPWSYLIPWFQRDMQARMAALAADRKARNEAEEWQQYRTKDNRTYWWSAVKNESRWELPEPEATLDPYNNPLVTPLKEWIELPIARELLHEGQLLQVLGLTNYSAWPEAGALRACLFGHPPSALRLRDVALQRLRRLHHVGLSEKLDESVASLAASLSLRLNATTYRYTAAHTFSYDGGSLHPEDMVTYNASSEEGGRNLTLTVTIARARERILELSRELWGLQEQLNVETPRLQRLVDEEADYLDAQEAANEAKGIPPPPPPPPGMPEKIDSPWAAEIEALDDKVADMQAHMERGKRELESLRSVAVVRVDEATGRARQLVPDDHFRVTEKLGFAYRKCERNGHERHKPGAAKPSKGYKALRTPAHESFAFSRQARKALDPAIRRRIAELNALDGRLYEEGAALLQAKVAEQRKARRLESFVNYDVVLAGRERPLAEQQQQQAEQQHDRGSSGGGKAAEGGSRQQPRRRSGGGGSAEAAESDPEVHDEL